MSDIEFLKDADQRSWNCLVNGSEHWDYVILTASNKSQGEGFQAQISERLESGYLSASTHYGVVPDPEGERVGNGGALLGALRYVSQYEKSFNGLKILVILSSGDSRRAAQYSAIGKIFSPVPRVLPNGHASTLFDEAIVALSPVPYKVSEGVLVISGDVMLAFDATGFEPGDAAAAAIAFPEPAITGCGHGVFLKNASGNIGKVWHKQRPEVLKSNGAVDEDGNVLIDTGAVFFSPKVADAIYGLICDDRGLCTEESFKKVVNGNLAPSLYVDFFYPLAEESTFEGYMAEIPEGKMTEGLLELRKRIWDALRPFRIKLCDIAPSRFIHFGTTEDVEALMSTGIDEYNYLRWERQVMSNLDQPHAAAYNSFVRGTIGERVYLEDCIVHGGKIGDRSILSGIELDGETVPSNIVMHCLKQLDGSYVTRIFGIQDNPKSGDACLFGKELHLGNVWHCSEKNLWNAEIYPACSSMAESIHAALNLYDIIHGDGDWDAWTKAQKESLYSSFCKADGVAIHKWQKELRAKIEKERNKR